MTPAQTKGSKPFTDAIGDVRTHVAAIVVIMQAAGLAIESPSVRAQAEALAETRTTVERLRVDMQLQRSRSDSLNVMLRQVQLLVRVRCVETKNEVIRGMLECGRL